MFPEWGYPYIIHLRLGFSWNKPSSYSGSPIYGNQAMIIDVYFRLWIVMQKMSYPLGTLIMENHHIQ